jgi:hypothetical protein
MSLLALELLILLTRAVIAAGELMSYIIKTIHEKQTPCDLALFESLREKSVNTRKQKNLGWDLHVVICDIELDKGIIH